MLAWSVNRDNTFSRSFGGHEVPSSQQLVAGEIRRQRVWLRKTVFSSKRKDVRGQSAEATPMAIMHAPCPRYPKDQWNYKDVDMRGVMHNVSKW